MAKSKQSTKKTREVSVQKEVVEDRSAFNCPDCGGDGLDQNQKICLKCSGTGKI